MDFLARVNVSIKPVINDPQGLTIAKTLKEIGFVEVDKVRFGKSIAIWFESDSEEKAKERIRLMCEKLLANQVLEEFNFEISVIDRS